MTTFLHRADALSWVMEGVEGEPEGLLETVRSAVAAEWVPPPPVTRRGYVSVLAGAETLLVRWNEALSIEVREQLTGPTGVPLPPRNALLWELGVDGEGFQAGTPPEWLERFTAVQGAALRAIARHFERIAPAIVPGSLAYWAGVFPGLLQAERGAADRQLSVTLLGAVPASGVVRAELRIVEHEVETSRTIVEATAGTRHWSSVDEAGEALRDAFARSGSDRLEAFLREL